MIKDLVKELTWRGMVHDMTPGTEEKLIKDSVIGYSGFDPTAPSLQIGNLVPVMMLVHLQRAGHKPLALVGGATGMIGDPSGKSEERNLLGEEEIRYNISRFKLQLEQFLDFDCGAQSAEIVDNYDWFSQMGFLEFLRDVGKHLTVGYMMAKESVQNRLESGISFTEFSYQLLQGYDFYHLYKNRSCVLQVGGSDQWGNITAGTELIRRKASGEAFALTCPLITKADGTKFGKSAAGERVWLDPQMTSPYSFYQFWLNCSDEDAGKFMRIFTLQSQEQIEHLEQEHQKAPHIRLLQKELAKDITIRVHSEQDYFKALEASQILFGKGTTETLNALSEKELLDIFKGVPQFNISKQQLSEGIPILELLVDISKAFTSRGEARKMLLGGGVSINKSKVTEHTAVLKEEIVLAGKYVLVQKGKKNYFLGIIG